MFQLEDLVKKDGVFCYAKNDRLEFNIPYEFYGNPRVYEPDYLVKLRNSVTLILEIKGQEREETAAKHQAAHRWVDAVNNWGQLGEWGFLPCWDPQKLPAKLVEWQEARRQRIKAQAKELQRKAEAEVERLRTAGWKQEDFARALRELLTNKEGE